MHDFEFAPADSAKHAVDMLTATGPSARVIAGGTDLLGEIKEGVATPAALISLHRVAELRGIDKTIDGVRIGAMATVADIAAHPAVRAEHPALAQAAAAVATPQIRNVGTLGGNLCQRPRCWYYRNPAFPDCRKRGGSQCYAHGGMNKFHAIFGGDICPSVHPSDTATALSALAATITIAGPNGERRIPIDDFFTPPEANVLTENALRPGEIVASATIPAAPAPRRRSVFLKAKERQAMDFALASVALAIDIDADANADAPDAVIRSARMTLGGVAPVPMRARAAESALSGKRPADIDAAAIGQLAIQGARPLSANRYKARLTAGLAARAVRVLLRADATQPQWTQ